MTDTPQPRPKQTFGKYVLIQELAKGGMGALYLAKLPGPAGFEKAVVLKRIRPQLVRHRDYIDMFAGEGRLLATLSHPNIVHVYEMGEVDGDYFMAMEYIHGQSLRTLLQRTRAHSKRIPAALVVEIIRGVCDGLWYAHNATDMRGTPLSVVHRDITPDNLMISYTGEPKLIDFGIAKSGLSLHETGLGIVKGKLKYMSPEQTVAQPLDKRSDIFALGVCLYEALTGMHPFAAAEHLESVRAIQQDTPQQLMLHEPGLAPFQPIIDRSLAKSPDDRYIDCSELGDALEGLLRTGQIIPHRESLGEYLQRVFEKEMLTTEASIHRADPSTSALIRIRDYQEYEQASPTVPSASPAPPTRATVLNEAVRAKPHAQQKVDWNARWLAGGVVLAIISLSIALGLALVRPDRPDVPEWGENNSYESVTAPPEPTASPTGPRSSSGTVPKPESSASRLQDCITRSGEFCGCDLIASAKTQEALKDFRGAASSYARFLVQCPDARSYLKIQTRMQNYISPAPRSRDPVIGGPQNVRGPNQTQTVRP